MNAMVIVLNGGSSAGKSEIARSLQDVLSEPWLAFGVDTLIEAMPSGLLTAEAGIVFGSNGQVSPGPLFGRLEDAWMHGLAAMARAGARVIIDDVFLSGAKAQSRWRKALQGLDVLWVGVRCDVGVAEMREAARGERIPGMARSQALIVHADVFYDVEVDTTSETALDCARQIAARLAH